MSATQTHKPLIGVMALLTATIFYGFFGLLTKLAGFELPIFFIGWVRNFVGAVFLLGTVVWLKQWVPVQKADWRWIVIRALCGVAGFFGSYFPFVYLSIGTAYFMFYGGSVLGGFLLGKFIFNEKLTPLKIASLIAALVGLSLIYTVSLDGTNLIWMWVAAAGGLSAAGWNTLTKKISGTYSAMQLNGLDYVIFGLVSFVASVALQEPWSWPTWSVGWLVNLAFLVIFTISAQMVVVGFKHLDAQRGSLIMLLEIVFGIFFGSLFFHEQLGILSWIGGGLIIAGAALPEVRELLKPQSKH
jgi:drug/metabolite transporter (DMT)-like permease